MTFFIALGVNAQVKPEKKAKKIANEMTEVLSLDKQESKAIYKIQLERFKEGEAIKKEYANQPEVKKQKLNKLGSKVYNQLKDYLGMDSLKKWKSHKKNN
ncbi:hypothetical protein GCM10022257_26120 [Hyunsoonleella aestuarii]|uniref:Uncharacterized protein n=2 Tax=Hyunsoonleella aestuarii TaxID=912802 RepID=A0ABP8EE38_9FLAO